ncbi:hypothetical protein AALO_G00293800 [Alosa alosa]|uniref:Integrase catalytic domain-containing protein n=1 Tax=Alosa alosa TaxID=278164 RepID=A0AAV6FKD5_9TELE|nr:hypothetical protein AALO_G00293800 [Alosa alosa]
MGKAKLSPQPEPTIPRLELCGAVLVVELAELILDELDHKPDAVKFYSDSKVVLGYIFNDSKRFFVYVHNRVHRIRQTTSPEQWHYVPSEQNPADLATRSVAASQLMDTMWFKGPDFLYKHEKTEKHEHFELIEPEMDVEVRPQILILDPYMSEGLLRVGGRLRHASLDTDIKHPIILPKHSHVTRLLVEHHHAEVKHQGRHFTEGAIRAAGLWIVAGNRLVSSVLYHCVTCRKLRGKLEVQKMADLPPERLDTSPPFSYVGLDVFGLWTVVTRRTQGGAAESKRWAILFTCMCTRGVHIETIESMDTASCINALRRFFAVRGPAKQLRSDRGTNFIAASVELGMRPSGKKQNSIMNYLHSKDCTWEFNPPHASHMGGVWERMIGVTRRILHSMLLQNKQAHLTHEVLCTLLAEVSAIINARPLIPVSSDPSDPVLLSPSMLLTQKPGLLAPPGDFTGKDLLKGQWRQVQALANEFWSRWRTEYLSTLHPRRKWNKTHRNLQPGDIVLLKQTQVPRNEWPMALVTSTSESSEGKVHKS